MGKKTPPFPNYPSWTTAKFWSFIRSGLRAKWLRWPARYVALNKAKKTVKGKGNRKYEYQCASCKGWFAQKDIEVDHIIPAGSLSSFEDLAGFVERLFVSEDKLQIVCRPCHKRKTNDDRS